MMNKVFWVMMVLMSIAIPAFASTGQTAVVTSEMLAPVVNAINNNLQVLIPVGISILAIMLGVALIPRIIHKFF